MSTGLRMVKLGLYDPGFEEEIAFYTFDEIYSWGASDLQTFEFRVASERTSRLATWWCGVRPQHIDLLRLLNPMRYLPVPPPGYFNRGTTSGKKVIKKTPSKKR